MNNYGRWDYPVIEQALEHYLQHIQQCEHTDNEQINHVKQLIHIAQDKIKRYNLGVPMGSPLYRDDFKR